MSDAILLAGEDRWTKVGRSTRHSYVAKGIPAREVADDLVAWFNEERGKIPPPDPFAGYEDALKRGLTLMIEWYTVTPDPAAFDHWISTLAGFRNGIARGARQPANADRLDILRAVFEGTAADVDVEGIA